ncbi:reverse transcriptase, partial [Phytophthora megakarya]
PAPAVVNTTPETSADDEPWLLRFDGACRHNPGPGGAGAALFAPNGKIVWTVAHYMTGRETNNTAEYTAMLLGAQSAVHHGARRLRIEGDSHLILSQVRGSFACSNKRLRALRNRVQRVLRELDWHRLMHIDRKANQYADRLANRALDLKHTVTECGPHDGSLEQCFRPSTLPSPDLTGLPPSDATVPPVHPAAMPDGYAETEMEDEAEVAARDGGEVFPTIPIGPHSAPAKQPRLRLRHLTEDEFDPAASAVTRISTELASKIADVDDWATGEGYIAAIPTKLREALLPDSSNTGSTKLSTPWNQHNARHRETRTGSARLAAESGASDR